MNTIVIVSILTQLHVHLASPLSQYYVTGKLTKSLYAPDCRFKDPTTDVKGKLLLLLLLQLLHQYHEGIIVGWEKDVVLHLTQGAYIVPGTQEEDLLSQLYNEKIKVCATGQCRSIPGQTSSVVSVTSVITCSIRALHPTPSCCSPGACLTAVHSQQGYHSLSCRCRAIHQSCSSLVRPRCI